MWVLYSLVIIQLNCNMFNIDTYISNSIAFFQQEKLVSVIEVLTELGGLYGLLFISSCIALFVFCKKIKFTTGVVMGMSILFALTTSVILKHVIERVRPPYSLILETGYSFPSNHATIAMVVYGFCIYLLHKYVDSSVGRGVCIGLFTFFILFVGFTRLYLGVHFFTDVIGGYVIGEYFLL